MPTQATPSRSLSTFLVLWAGQVVSLFGSRLTGFALGVWVYQTTGSVTRFALISFFTMVPSVVLLPVAGMLTDRFPRKWVMILSDTGAALSTAAVAYFLWQDALELGLLYLLMALIAAFSAPQQLAFDATVPLLVPRRHLDRANALHQLGSGLAEIAAPMVAGILIVQMALEGIVLVDITTFLFAATTLLFLTIPSPLRRNSKAESGPEAGNGKKAALERFLFGWRFIRKHPGLVGLLFYFFSLNFSRSAVLVLVTPLVLSFSTPVMLGRVLSLGALGMVVGGIVLVLWGGGRRRMRTIYAATLVYSATVVLSGWRADLITISVAAFLMLSTGPFLNSTVQSLWQSKVPLAWQGQVFAARRMVSWSAIPLGYLAAGPFSDFVFEPMMAEQGALASVFGPLLGTGPGRGIGLFLVLLGLSGFLTWAIGFTYPSLRHLEDEMPDAIEEAEDADDVPMPAPAELAAEG